MAAALPFLLVVFPFGVLFGVVATEAGLDLVQTMGMTFVVIAGASQFTAVQLMSENAPVWTVLAASLAVNLRMAMYSASLQPHVGAAPFWARALVGYTNFDQTYAMSMLEYERAPDMTPMQKVAYFLGAATTIIPGWCAATYAGAVGGALIPDSVGLEFAMPIMFLAMVAPMVRSLAHLAAAATSVIVALLAAGLPSGVGLLVAAFAAMLVGAEVERRRGGA
ncbi:AzlC family ABC transporter permease [Kangsaoukella pontilimi]|nr:AzlC family ABC transporter permease [Kangsaoukella pontilimi]